jgi:hypothetical protein
MKDDESTRADLVHAGGDSKLKRKKVFHGFLVNTYEALKGKLNGHEIDLCPLHGSFAFVNDYRNFTIPPEVTVVVVENFENFRLLMGQKHLFKHIQPLFVWRFRNSIDIVNWLNLIPNNYLHYGDFDPKGLHIYVSEFRHKIPLGRSDFFKPSGIEDLLSEFGKKERYEDQMEYLKNIDFEGVPEIAELFLLIKKLKRGLDQEVLISKL